MINEKNSSSVVNSTYSRVNHESFNDMLEILSAVLTEGIKGVLISSIDKEKGSSREIGSSHIFQQLHETP